MKIRARVHAKTTNNIPHSHGPAPHHIKSLIKTILGWIYTRSSIYEPYFGPCFPLVSPNSKLKISKALIFFAKISITMLNFQDFYI